MRVLAIDLGTYSVKIVEAILDKKKSHILRSEEILMDSYCEENKTTPIQGHRQIVGRELSNFEGNMSIFCYPLNKCAIRFERFPVSSKRKANLMIPFKIDESMPFNSQDVHFSAQYVKEGKSLYSIYSVIPKETFQEDFDLLNEEKALPNILSTEVGVMQSYLLGDGLQGDICYLDLGHLETKIYFVHDGLVCSFHRSSFSGKIVDEAISNAYQVLGNAAQKYKHESGFFLTERQYSEVDDNQKEFAVLMKNIMSPLIRDLKKWDLGHRVAYGGQVSCLFISGGMSNMKNIGNFLAQELSLEVRQLAIPDEILSWETPVKKSEKWGLNNCLLMIESIRTKNIPMNLLSGSFARQDTEGLPLYSLGFIFIRLSIICFCLMIPLTLERLHFSKRTKFLNKSLAKALKSPELEIGRKDRRLLKHRPHRLAKKFKSQQRKLRSEIKYFEKILKINGLKPLEKLIPKIPRNLEVMSYVFNGEDVKVKVSGAFNDLKAVKNSFDDKRFHNLKISLDKNGPMEIEWKVNPK